MKLLITSVFAFAATLSSVSAEDGGCKKGDGCKKKDATTLTVNYSNEGDGCKKKGGCKKKEDEPA
jgi:hypothetical protein